MGTSARLNAQLTLSYKTIYGEKVVLEEESYYDIESKPMIYEVKDDNKQEGMIYLVELYRLLSKYDEPEDLEMHFYRSFSIIPSKDDLDIPLEGIFHDFNSSFFVPQGFVIKVCKVRKERYLSLRQRSSCEENVKYTILSGD